MRKIKIQSILVAVAGLFLATSCSSSFLDTDPTDAVSSDKVSVPENAEALVNGAWYNLFDYSSTYANIGYRALQCLDDMMASDVVSRPKYGFNSSYQFNDIALSSNSRTEFAWYLIYKTIDNCNTAISIKGDSEELRQVQGQALALRAFCYLHLVHLVNSFRISAIGWFKSILIISRTNCPTHRIIWHSIINLPI